MFYFIKVVPERRKEVNPVLLHYIQINIIIWFSCDTVVMNGWFKNESLAEMFVSVTLLRCLRNITVRVRFIK